MMHKVTVRIFCITPIMRINIRDPVYVTIGIIVGYQKPSRIQCVPNEMTAWRKGIRYAARSRRKKTLLPVPLSPSQTISPVYVVSTCPLAIPAAL